MCACVCVCQIKFYMYMFNKRVDALVGSMEFIDLLRYKMAIITLLRVEWKAAKQILWRVSDLINLNWS